MVIDSPHVPGERGDGDLLLSRLYRLCNQVGRPLVQAFSFGFRCDDRPRVQIRRNP